MYDKIRKCSLHKNINLQKYAVFPYVEITCYILIVPIVVFLRGDKKKDMHRAKGKQDLDIVTEHYQAVIKNLQADREKVQRERDAAILRYQQQFVCYILF